MDWLEQKYVNILGSRLRNFKRKSGNVFNFSCPICGDSHKISTKARGYVYDKAGKGLFHCHNCGASMRVPNFIKMVDAVLYEEYLMEKLADKPKSKEELELEEFVKKILEQYGGKQRVHSLILSVNHENKTSCGNYEKPDDVGLHPSLRG